MKARSKGFSLMESLIAVLVLSIGMLGVGGMFAGMLSSQRSALVRTKAVAYAADLAGRIRANPMAGGDYSSEGSGFGSHGCAQAAGNENPSACAPGDLAGDDRYQWETLVTSGASGLPEAEVNIEQIDTAPVTYLVTISWAEGRSNDGADLRSSYSLQVIP